MCSIVGSFDKMKLKELIELNSYRGNHSYSLSEYDISSNKLEIIDRDFGEFNYGLLDKLTPKNYYIAHTQAPTTSIKNKDSIHPSQYLESYLWHNGIIKEDYINTMQEKLFNKNNWDTALLNEFVYYGNDLGDVDGTFSCLGYYDKELILFRNEISPMFIDNNFNISSTKFQNSYPTIPNQISLMNFKTMELNPLKIFKTKENPYYFYE